MEKLSPDEWDRLEYLLGKDHVVGIDQVELDEITHLVKRMYPDSTFKNKKDLTDFAIVIVGTRLMMRQVRLTHPKETFLHPEKVYADVYSEKED